MSFRRRATGTPSCSRYFATVRRAHPIGRLHIFVARGAGDGRYVIAGLFGNVAQNHGAQAAFVACEEEVALPVEYGLHGGQEGLLPLLDGVDKRLGGVDFLFDKEQGVPFLAGLVGPVSRVVAQHLVVVATDAQGGYVAVVERQGELAIVFLDEEIGADVGHALGKGVIPAASRFGVEL